MDYAVRDEKTLFEAVKALAPDSSNTTCRSWIKEGRVQVDGVVQEIPTTAVKRGQKIEVTSKVKKQEPFKILYQDPHLVVIDKPYNLLSVSTPYDTANTAHEYLKQIHKRGKVFVVHRLDKETSGVMLFALSEEGFTGLKELFKTHDLIREYVAIVEGAVEENQGTWQCYLYEDSNYFVHATDNPEGAEWAVTHYKVIKRKRGMTTLQLTLETGKKNQIRVHCQQAGHPVVGDKKYGAKTNPFKRLALHAERLQFVHPITKKELNFTSPLPRELTNAS